MIKYMHTMKLYLRNFDLCQLYNFYQILHSYSFNNVILIT